MLRLDVRRTFLPVEDPTSAWHGRLGQIDHGPGPSSGAVWWRDTLTGTRVQFPLPTATH